MVKEGAGNNIETEIPKSRPQFVPNVTARKFTQGRIYDRIRYICRIPIANSFTQSITALVLFVTAANAFAYAWKGSGHPLNRYRWRRMKENGQLSPALLEKEKIYQDYFEDLYKNPREPMPRVSFH